MTTLQQLLDDSPKLHRVEPQAPTSYQLSDQALNFIDQNVDRTSNTLETGAGISTVLFAMKGANHTCIVPDSQLVARIIDYCQHASISMEGVNFQIGKSEKILPVLETNELDLLLIDGEHAFPTPFIDWYYTADRLRVGGVIIVDDTQLWTGQVLKRFLLEEPEWSLVEEFSARTAIFKKEKAYSHEKWWGQQPYVLRKSRRLIAVSEARKAFTLLARGEFRTLITKVKARISNGKQK
jgi:predicted O-methyltransferase YrrM